MSDASDSSITTRLPINLLEKFLSHLTHRKDIASASLVCRSFRAPAQQLLFRELCFTGWRFNDIPTKKQKAPLRYTLARIAGLLGSPLRFYIQCCTLLNWTSGHPETTVWEAGERLYKLIGALPNLCTARCTYVLFKSDQFASLCSAPSLRSLSLNECTFPFDESLPYQLENIELIEPKGLTGTGIVGFAYATTGVLLPTHLKTLDLTAPTSLANIISSLLNVPPFEHLTTLRIALRPDTQIVSFLNRCPSIRNLEIIGRGDTDSRDLMELPKEALPHLWSFGGPPQVILKVLPGRSVQKLTVHADDGDGGADSTLLGLQRFMALDDLSRSKVIDLVVYIQDAISLERNHYAPEVLRRVFPHLERFRFV